MKLKHILRWILIGFSAVIVMASCPNPVQTELLTAIESKVDDHNAASNDALTISSTGGGTTVPTGTNAVKPGAATHIVATPEVNCAFVRWAVASGTASFANANAADTTVTVDGGNATITAVFSSTLTVNAGAGGTVSPSGALGGVIIGAATSIAATPGSGYSFVNWTATSGAPSFGDANAASTTVTLTSGAATIQANFTSVQYLLTVQSGGHGAATPSGIQSVFYGAATGILAVADPGYHFVNWTVSGSASVASAGNASTTVTLTSGNATIQANFAINTYQLTVQSGGNGSTTPNGTQSVSYGASTRIIASPFAGYRFMSWSVVSGSASIADTGAVDTTVVLTSGSATVQANFTNVTYTLTISSGGNGSTSPSGPVSVNHGAGTTITATPSTGYHFVNWTVTSGSGVTFGNLNAANTTVTLTSGNATVQANFALNQYTLTINSGGHGTTNPSGPTIVSHGAAPTITATPSANYHFVNWTVTSGSGVTIGNQNAASTTVSLVNGDATIQANFTIDQYPLTVNSSGGGTTNPSGTANVNYGGTPAILATASAGYHFVNWTVTSGAASIANANAASTSVTITGTATIQANFVKDQYSLTINSTAGGTTTPSGKIDNINYGDSTPISATKSTGYHFVNWTVTSGAASIANANAASTSVIITGTSTIQANFAIDQYSLTIAGDSYGTTTPSGTLTVNHGTATAINVSVVDHHYFSGWAIQSGSGVTFGDASSASTTVTLTGGAATIHPNIGYGYKVNIYGHNATPATPYYNSPPGNSFHIYSDSSYFSGSIWVFNGWIFSAPATGSFSNSASNDTYAQITAADSRGWVTIWATYVKP